MTSQEMFDLLEEAGGNPTWYSGRGMYGAECLAISGSPAEVWGCVAKVISARHDEIVQSVYDNDETVDLAKTSQPFYDDVEALLVNHRSDQLGLGVVIYFPSFPRSQP